MRAASLSARFATLGKPYTSVEIVELGDKNPAACGGEDGARSAEGMDIVRAVKDSYVVLLAIEGKSYTSEEIAERLEALMLSGTSDISFVIGGSYGLSREVQRRADETISFGRITLPHNLARVVLVEQLYRAFKIMRGEPYHK